jgi:hypothetical protein
MLEFVSENTLIEKFVSGGQACGPVVKAHARARAGGGSSPASVSLKKKFVRVL